MGFCNDIRIFSTFVRFKLDERRVHISGFGVPAVLLMFLFYFIHGSGFGFRSAA